MVDAFPSGSTARPSNSKLFRNNIDESTGMWNLLYLAAGEEPLTATSAALNPDDSEPSLVALSDHNPEPWDTINDNPSLWIKYKHVASSNTDATSTIKNEVVLFELGRLPADLQYYILKFFLTSPNGVLNPWEDDTAQTRSWSRYLRPNIIATCKDIYRVGTKILYEANDFHFARLSSPVNGIETDPQAIQRFLSYRHGLRRALDYPGTTVVRGQLIRNILLHPGYCGSENSEIIPSAEDEPNYLGHAWQFNTLRHLEFVGCHLNQLTITFAEACVFLLNHLHFESEMRAIGTLGDRFTIFPAEEILQRGRAWRTLQSDHRGLVEEPWPLEHAYELSPYGCWAESVIGLHTDKLYIRGLSASESGRRSYGVNGRELPTASLARQVMKWLEQTGINNLTVEFTGSRLL